MKVKFFVPMVIPTATHNRLAIRTKLNNGKRVPFIGKTDELKRAEAKWMAHLGKHVPLRPLEGALRADMRICFATDNRHAQGDPMTDTPDLDNVEKTLWDVLQKLGYIADDKLVCDKRVRKMWGDPPGLFLMIEEIKVRGQ